MLYQWERNSAFIPSTILKTVHVCFYDWRSANHVVRMQMTHKKISFESAENRIGEIQSVQMKHGGGSSVQHTKRALTQSPLHHSYRQCRLGRGCFTMCSKMDRLVETVDEVACVINKG